MHDRVGAHRIRGQALHRPLHSARTVETGRGRVRGLAEDLLQSQILTGDRFGRAGVDMNERSRRSTHGVVARGGVLRWPERGAASSAATPPDLLRRDIGPVRPSLFLGQAHRALATWPPVRARENPIHAARRDHAGRVAFGVVRGPAARADEHSL